MTRSQLILKCTFVTLLTAACSKAFAIDPIPLRAGPMTMLFDAENVFLRYVKLGDHEVLRGINAPIRNENWATIAPKVRNLRVRQFADNFRVDFEVLCQRGDIDFRWNGSLTGNDRGIVEFTFDGEAHSTFRRNRIGFCVLHGPGAAGQPWFLKSADGKISSGAFPKLISPHQPAKNLRSVTHQIVPGIHAVVEFEGEVFEMEDQRNWTDASFKTYCTPLELPYPVEVPKGTKISQKVRIKIDGDISEMEPESSGRTILTMGKSETALPKIGLQVSSEVNDLTNQQLERLAALNLDHLYVDLALSDAAFLNQLTRATKQAKALGVALHLVIGLGDAPDLSGLAQAISELQPPIRFCLVRGGDPDHFQRAQQRLVPVLGKAKIGVTRVTNFVDLNRSRPKDQSVQAVGFAINPQIHAFDNASIVESLPIHADAVRSALDFTGGRPLVVGPITMAPQLLDGVDQPGGPPQGGPLPTSVDPRQVEPLTAAWTLGSLKYLADAGAHSATFFETVGWLGVMDLDDVSARPKQFPSRPGKRFPVYHLLHEIGQFGADVVAQIHSSNTLSAVALALRKTDSDGNTRQRVLIANLQPEAQSVVLRGLGANAVSVQVLGGKRRQLATEVTVDLPPYGVARMDGNSGL